MFAGKRDQINQFGLPRGLLGRVAGWIMARANTANQEETAGPLGVLPGDRVLEIGYGPGRLVRLLAERTEAALIAGVDPSPVMLAQASRANRDAVRAGRVNLRTGTAERLPFPDATFDRVVSVNNVQLWPDLAAGLKEVHRVLVGQQRPALARPGGRAQGGPPGAVGLPEAELDRVRDELQALFREVTRHERIHSVVFAATR
ncbi:class I SAM-dependent methyltransferase [Carbonactinospora thermoautotrophica]|uniref:class I SAM-dependent methyltransferase n=1 Tax=Carbonactinospora thermoautotrophica TaxID=1469144 RepID=UPI003DA9B88C